MDRFTLIITTVVISVLLSVAAVVSGATGALQDVLMGTGPERPAPSNNATVATGSPAVDLSELNDLRSQIDDLRAQLVAASSAEERPAISREAELEERLSLLQRVNDEQAEQIKKLQETLANAGSGGFASGPVGSAEGAAGAEGEGAVVGGALVPGTPQFTSAVKQAMDEVRKAERDEQMLARRDRAKAEILERAPRIAEFMMERLELDAAQAAIVEGVIVEFATARADLEYQAYQEDWDQETRRTQFESLTEKTRSSLESAGLNEDQLNGVQRMAGRVGGGGGRDGGFGGGRGPGGGGR